MDVSFGAWLDDILNQRGLSKAELARLSGLSKQAISDYTNLRRLNPDSNALNAIAVGLKMPIETVYRAAGLLPPISEADALADEFSYLWNSLSPSDQSKAIDFLRFMARAPRSDTPLIYEIFDQISREPRHGFLVLVQDPDEVYAAFEPDRFRFVQHAQIPGQGWIFEVIDDEEGKKLEGE